jgi:hypothetical protein
MVSPTEKQTGANVMSRATALLPMIAELKQHITLSTTPVSQYYQANRWQEERSWVDANYYQQPDVYAGFYEVVEIGNGGRELLLIDCDGRKFCVHQDHASIVVG